MTLHKHPHLAFGEIVTIYPAKFRSLGFAMDICNCKLISHHLLLVNYNWDDLRALQRHVRVLSKNLKPLADRDHAVSLKGHCWRSEFIQHFPKGGVNQKHTGGKTGWPLSHCARLRRRERDFPWHWGPNTIPSLSKRHIASGGSHNHVTLYFCVGYVGLLNVKCWDFYLHDLWLH